ncbi:MAG: 50S ribosomal protein L25/general stress protein Ctc [Gammaproteobacteria bacterium]|nr:50S ribosomal protein L25/general stress protein Ctc [Sideroxydans sp.]MBU3904065.1 50S ribosomal protein L25/general stress protein Ctc [Gammaproteobacteria bacterium]MBU4044809.1 50S ribosomal protein L25/general stress protein Ctc [Gammaproteobacteria bacterium]MBU4150356.1 50S ribosomal protein L25/general stress protein Ctc [Gammaproteobacteria bacterium]
MSIEISATKRQVQGTGASRRLRKANRVPAVVYGSGDAVMIELDHNTIYFALKNEAFHASVLSLEVEGKKESVLLRDFQMHPFRQQVQHVDFQRVDAKKKVHMKVPLHFVNAEIAPGVKQGGGIITHVLNELDIACLAKDLPTAIEIDLAGLELGHSIHISDVKLPKGVEVATHHHAADAVATVTVPRGHVEAAAEAAAAADASAASTAAAAPAAKK